MMLLERVAFQTAFALAHHDKTIKAFLGSSAMVEQERLPHATNFAEMRWGVDFTNWRGTRPRRDEAHSNTFCFVLSGELQPPKTVQRENDQARNLHKTTKTETERATPDPFAPPSFHFAEVPLLVC